MNDAVPGDESDDQVPVPWSFKIMVGLAVLYLGWRLIELIIWVFERLT